MAEVRPYRWLVERLHRRVIQREMSRVLVLHLYSGQRAVLAAPEGKTVP